MSKKKNEIIANDVIEYNLVDLLEDRYGRYSKYIIQDRALPDVRDGLKPVQRRILYAMHHDGNTANKAYRKSAKTVGLVIGNYHPHGDSSVYEAMVRMSQSWKMNHPLIDMQGNNGSIDDDPAAAMRYTETRLAPIAHELLNNIEEKTVDFAWNFSDSELEPVVLPAGFCNILVNGATGIASGYATNIPPFNLQDVMNACIYRLQHPQGDPEEIYDIIKAPDFPTGGIIQGKDGCLDILKTGQGKIVVRSKAVIEESNKLQQIIITEIPYDVVKQNLVKKMDEIRFNDNISEILDIRDESDRNGIRIVIDVKKEADAQTLLNLFYKQTDLQVNFNANMVVIDNLRPKLMGVVEIVDTYLEYRKEIVIKRTQYRHQKIQDRLHIIEGLMKAVSHLDEVIKIIRASLDRSDAKKNLMERFDFSDTQAESIITLRLYRLSNTDIVELKEEFAQLLNDLEFLNSILNQDAILTNELVSEFKDIIKTYGVSRRSELEKEVSEIVIDKTALIPDEEVMISITQEGYVKRSSLRSYQASDQFYSTIKENDVLITQGSASLQNTLCFITKKGQYGLIIVNDLIEHRWKDVGSHISSIVSLDYDDEIISAFLIDDFRSNQYLMCVSSLGKIKKVLVSDLEVTRTSKTYRLMKLSKADTLVSSYLIDDFDEILLISKNGYVVRYSADMVSAYGLSAAGVQSMRLAHLDEVVDSTVIKDNDELIVLTQDDLIKRVKSDKIVITGRPAKGMLIAKSIKSNPNIVKCIYTGQLYDRIPFYTLDDEVQVFTKDVTLMTHDQTYSKAILQDAQIVSPLLLSKTINRVDDDKDTTVYMQQVSFDIK